MQIISNFKLALGQQGYLFLLNIFIGAIIARTLGPSLMGVFIVIQVVAAYAEIIGRSKVDVTATMHYGDDHALNKKILQNVNAISILSGLSILAIIFIFKNQNN
jgi:O-antigen/teichoic acid export membrane protein